MATITLTSSPDFGGWKKFECSVISDVNRSSHSQVKKDDSSKPAALIDCQPLETIGLDIALSKISDDKRGEKLQTYAQVFKQNVEKLKDVAPAHDPHLVEAEQKRLAKTLKLLNHQDFLAMWRNIAEPAQKNKD